MMMWWRRRREALKQEAKARLAKEEHARAEREARLNEVRFECKECGKPVLQRTVDEGIAGYTLYHKNEYCSVECCQAVGEKVQKERERKQAELDAEMERLASDPQALEEAMRSMRNDRRLEKVRQHRAAQMGLWCRP